ncbi:MAG TPA: hypothetical protein DGG94_02485 [Micromonosporaceae bacterium]|nr:hypothetical protein [Micromonosporaceae bacterium]HCU48687.1 hypothetical protein [Micromonosporaceae bacterium]
MRQASRPRLDEWVWDLLHEALDLYGDDRGAAEMLRHHIGRFEEPLRVAIAGPSKSGKSTLVNAILGEEIAPVEVGEGKNAFTWYQDGPEPHITAYSGNGSSRELPVVRSTGGIRIDIGGWRPDRVNDIVVTWPTRALRHAILLDTPAVAASEEDGQGSTIDRVLSDADAVLYLTPDVRSADLRILQSAQEGDVARAAPINVLLVLSRADEIGGGRIDALLAAKQLARQHYRDPQVNSMCMGVTALGGLIALASRLLSEGDFTALKTMANAPRADIEVFLLSTDRVVGNEFPVPIATDIRRGLLDRFGIHGIRLATTLIRTGSDTRAKLAAEMVKRSGLAELRESMNQYFIERRDVLKARSALVALDFMLRSQPRRGAAELLAHVERIIAGSHDFSELRLLATLRATASGFDSELAAEAHRLVGGNGINMAARLGVDHDANGVELWALSNEALYRWQNQAEDPRLSLNQQRAARVVVRSCEGLLADLAYDRR